MLDCKSVRPVEGFVSDGMNDEQYILHAILGSYGLDCATPYLLGSLWNRVYRIEAEDGQRYSLRLCPLALQDRRSLEDELIWLELVASRQQVRVPRPVRNQQQDLITTLAAAEGERLSCLFEWVAGQPAHQNLTPSVMRQIGQAVARLHGMARELDGRFRESDFRGRYHYGSSLAASHREWIETHQAQIGGENVRLLNLAVTWLLDALKRMGETSDNYGLIHADLHFGNFLIHNGKVSVIDFDQLGWGHYAYDLAVLKVELDHESGECVDLWDDFIRGYQQVSLLPFEEENEIAALMVAVNLAFLDWVYNSPNAAVRQQMGPRLPAAFESIKSTCSAL